MATTQLSPEERLLRIIESGEGEGAQSPASAPTVPWSADRGLSRLRTLAWTAVKGMDLKAANWGLVIALMAAVAGLVADLRRPRPTPAALTTQVTVVGPQEEVEAVAAVPKPLGVYLDEAQGRDLFSPVLPPPEPQPVAEAKEASSPPPAPPPPTSLAILQKQVVGLKLVGIACGRAVGSLREVSASESRPDADQGQASGDLTCETGMVPIAMIEEIDTRKTHFLAAGDALGEVEVRFIAKDLAVLGYKEAEYELF